MSDRGAVVVGSAAMEGAMSDATIEATSISALRTDGAEDAPLLPRSLLKQRWGEHFRAVRQAKNISQERLAARAGVALSAVANWEQGRNLPKDDSLVAMKALLPQLRTPGEVETQLVAELAAVAKQPSGRITDQQLLESTSARVTQLETEVEQLRRENETLRAELVQMRSPAPLEAAAEPSQGASEGPCEGQNADGGQPSQGAATEPLRDGTSAAALASQGPKGAGLWAWPVLRRLRALHSMFTSLAAFLMLSLMFSTMSSGGGGGFCSSDEGESKPACSEKEFWDEEYKKCRRKEPPPLRDCSLTDGERPCCESGQEQCGPP